MKKHKKQIHKEYIQTKQEWKKQKVHHESHSLPD